MQLLTIESIVGTVLYVTHALMRKISKFCPQIAFTCPALFQNVNSNFPSYIGWPVHLPHTVFFMRYEVSTSIFEGLKHEVF